MKTHPIKLYKHVTYGGAIYLTDTFLQTAGGHREGIFEGASIVVRLDGQPEITIRSNFAAALSHASIDVTEQVIKDLTR